MVYNKRGTYSEMIESRYIRRERAHAARLKEQKDIMYGKGFRIGLFVGICGTAAAAVIVTTTILTKYGVIT